MFSSTDLNAMDRREMFFPSRNSNPDCSAVQPSGSLVVTDRQAQVTDQELCGLRDISNKT